MGLTKREVAVVFRALMATFPSLPSFASKVVDMRYGRRAVRWGYFLPRLVLSVSCDDILFSGLCAWSGLYPPGGMRAGNVSIMRSRGPVS